MRSRNTSGTVALGVSVTAPICTVAITVIEVQPAAFAPAMAVTASVDCDTVPQLASVVLYVMRESLDMSLLTPLSKSTTTTRAELVGTPMLLLLASSSTAVSRLCTIESVADTASGRSRYMGTIAVAIVAPQTVQLALMLCTHSVSAP